MSGLNTTPHNMTLKASEDVALSAVRRMDSFNFLFMLHSQPDSRYPESKPRLFGVKVSEIILHEARAHRNTMCSLDHLVYAIHRKTCLFLTGSEVFGFEDFSLAEKFSGTPLVDFRVLLNRLEKGTGSKRQILTQYVADRVTPYCSAAPKAVVMAGPGPLAWSDDQLLNTNSSDYVWGVVNPGAQPTEEPQNKEEKEPIPEEHADRGTLDGVLSKSEQEWAEIVAHSSSV